MREATRDAPPPRERLCRPMPDRPIPDSQDNTNEGSSCFTEANWGRRNAGHGWSRPLVDMLNELDGARKCWNDLGSDRNGGRALQHTVCCLVMDPAGRLVLFEGGRAAAGRGIAGRYHEATH